MWLVVTLRTQMLDMNAKDLGKNEVSNKRNYGKNLDKGKPLLNGIIKELNA